MPVNDDVERVLKFRVGALASNCNKLCDIACKDLADFNEVQSELVKLVIHLQSRKQGKSTPNVNVEGINDSFVIKSKGAPSKSVQGNPCERSDGNASAKDLGFSPERFSNSSRSFSVKSEDHSGPKTKRSLHESSESIDIASMNGFFNKNLYSLKQVKDSQQDKGHSFTNYECDNDVMDEKCDTPHVQNDVQDLLPSSMPYGNKQGSYMTLFASMHKIR
ncbi:uncharacterized protein DS421_16g533530 [Arachis hypogaea]|nr:uncharacterized protein DS421_16g533530 [Arachis hypogaea]